MKKPLSAKRKAKTSTVHFVPKNSPITQTTHHPPPHVTVKQTGPSGRKVLN